MNILFLYGGAINPERGGVQRVTAVLADELATRGNAVFYLALPKNRDDTVDPSRQFYLPEATAFFSPKNRAFFENFLRERKIDVVVNQGGWSIDASRLAYTAKRCGVPAVCVLHNGLLDVPRHFSSVKGLSRKWGGGLLSKILSSHLGTKVLLRLYKLKYKTHMRELRHNADRVLLLSSRFRQDFEFFLAKKDVPASNLGAISNPSSFPRAEVDFSAKKKELLWVGRIDFGQKRPDLMLKIWSLLEARFPEWSLRFLGDGAYLPALKSQASALGLKRVFFEGFQKPEKFYRDASIFCLTSSYEGFGMVLVEASAFGCVPVAFDSFAAVHDILEDGETGVLVPAFDCENYAEKLAFLMENRDARERLAKNALATIPERLSTPKIVDHWEKLFNEVLNEKTR